MTFKDLIDKYNWSDINNVMQSLYPEELKNIEGYEQVFNVLKTLTPIESNMELFVRPVKEFDSDDYYYMVSGIKKTSGAKFCISFCSWEEWLGMEANSTIDEKEFIVHCLYEMTFNGFDQETINEKENYLINIADEIDLQSEE